MRLFGLCSIRVALEASLTSRRRFGTCVIAPKTSSERIVILLVHTRSIVFRGLVCPDGAYCIRNAIIEGRIKFPISLNCGDFSNGGSFIVYDTHQSGLLIVRQGLKVWLLHERTCPESCVVECSAAGKRHRQSIVIGRSEVAGTEVDAEPRTTDSMIIAVAAKQQITLSVRESK